LNPIQASSRRLVIYPFGVVLFQDGALEGIMQTLKKDKIESLDLSACFLKESEYLCLCKHINDMPALRFLSIRSSRIAYQILMKLFSSDKLSHHLKILDVSYLKFDETSSQELLKLIKLGSLTGLNLRYCSFPKIEAIIKCAFQESRIENLNLSCLKIPKLEIEDFNPSLKTLDLSSSHICEDDFTSVDFPDLESINLDMIHMNLKSSLDIFFKKHRKLNKISLINCDLTFEGIFNTQYSLKELTALKNLQLQGNYLCDSGCELLIEILPKSIEVLNLEHNHLTDESLECLKKLLNTHNLKEINLRSNPKLDVLALIEYGKTIHSNTKVVGDYLC
jgi:Leucine Rich repeat